MRLTNRRPLRLTTLALATAAVVGCSARTLEPRLTDHAFATEVASPLAGPTLTDTSFRVDVEGVTLWLAFADVLDTHAVRVRWRDPRGRVQSDTGPIAINRDGGYRPRAGLAVRLPIRGAPASLLPGEWAAEVSWDERPLISRTFALREAR